MHSSRGRPETNLFISYIDMGFLCNLCIVSHVCKLSIVLDTVLHSIIILWIYGILDFNAGSNCVGYSAHLFDHFRKFSGLIIFCGLSFVHTIACVSSNLGQWWPLIFIAVFDEFLLCPDYVCDLA